MEKHYIVTLELYETDTSSTDILYTGGDRGVYPLTIRLLSAGAPFPIPAGTVASLRFGADCGRSSGGIASVVDAANGTLHYDVQTANLTESGGVQVFVSLQTGEDRKLTWPPFYARIRGFPNCTGASPPEADAPYWELVNSKLAELNNKIINMIQITGDSDYVFKED